MINQTKNPRVSIIIATYNYRKYLQESLESILKQTFTDYEVLVVDDGSTDNTDQLIAQFQKKFQGRLRYHYQENQGVYAARNVGLNLARGEFIGFLDADDIWHKTLLENFVRYLDKNENKAFVYSNVEFFDSKTNKKVAHRFGEGSNKKPYTGRCVDQLFQNGNFIPFSANLARQDVLQKVGKFDRELRVGGDYDYWMKLTSRFDIGYIPKILCRMRRHETSLSFKGLTQAKAQLRINKNILKYSPEIKKRIGEEALQQKWFKTYYALGTSLILNNQGREGRENLRKALEYKVNPFANKLWLYYVISYFPVIDLLKKFRGQWHKKREKMFIRYRS
ncbi:MAG: glycosyltransferase [Candidatus Omnitrophica bacterium]|nr:glycosyltransferase [Candidatus Omnitrophota bacterium]MCB9747528.1 glycosyltransferase [Candidatus Omnitrophota bacterium]